MKFGLFGSAAARRGSPEFDSSEGFRDFIDYNIEAEALGFHSTFVVEHHFTGFGQVSATLNLLTWLGARTSRLRLGTAVTVLPWHSPTGRTRRRPRWSAVCKTACVSCVWQRGPTARYMAGRTGPPVIRARSTYVAPCTAVPKRLRSSSRPCAPSAPVTSSSTAVALAAAPGAARA